MESLPLQIPPGYPSHQANRLPPGLTLPSALPLLSRHTLPAAAAPLSLASTSAPFSLVPHPPPHLPPTPQQCLILLQPASRHPGALCPPRKTPSIPMPRVVPDARKVPSTCNGGSPMYTGCPHTCVHRRCACTLARTVWVHEPTSPHTRTHALAHTAQTQAHTQANTQPLTHSHTLHRTRRCTHACTCELPHHQGDVLLRLHQDGRQQVGHQNTQGICWTDRDVCQLRKAG